MLKALSHWPPPVYNERYDCTVCASGGFCQEAATELAHDIAANLIIAGSLQNFWFPVVRDDVLNWMADNDIQGGDMMELGDRYLADRKAAHEHIQAERDLALMTQRAEAAEAKLAVVPVEAIAVIARGMAQTTPTPSAAVAEVLYWLHANRPQQEAQP